MERNWSEAALAAFDAYPWRSEDERRRAREEAELVAFGADATGEDPYSCGIYSWDDSHIDRLGMAAPVSRIMVRQPNNKGNAGAPNNGMPPTSSMGCGTWGGNIVSENITLKHYMNTTWVSRVILTDMPPLQELFGEFYHDGMDEE